MLHACIGFIVFTELSFAFVIACRFHLSDRQRSEIQMSRLKFDVRVHILRQTIELD